MARYYYDSSNTVFDYPVLIPRNDASFTEVFGDAFGRMVIYTYADHIDTDNIADELAKALPKHNWNAAQIAYLDRYYRGDQPILYRAKKVRPEINNCVVENHAYELVESNVADLYGEPVQYALHNSDDEGLMEEINSLNTYMRSEDKPAIDIERGRWAAICGTSYLYVGGENRMPKDYDEAPFYLSVENPMKTFVVYYADDGTPAFSVQIRKDDEGTFYHCWTHAKWFQIRNAAVVASGINGRRYNPVIEYPLNERRLSVIEITIGLTDALNKMASDRMNGIEQFVQAFMLFKNCDIDKDKFLEMVGLGAVSVKDTASGKAADVKIMAEQLDQSQAQVAKDDLYQQILLIQGKPGRQENSGGDTGQAVVLRNGYYDEDKRAELRIPYFVKSERMMLRVVLHALRVDRRFRIRLSDIDIKPKRSKLENMMVKAQVAQILHSIGYDDGEITKLINLWPDPANVYALSKEAMKEQFESANGLGEYKQTQTTSGWGNSTTTTTETDVDTSAETASGTAL